MAKVVVKNTRMDVEMTQAACDTAQAAMMHVSGKKYRFAVHQSWRVTMGCAYCFARECETEKEVAAYIKAAFEKEYGCTWHCFVGRNFGAYVTHDEGRAIYFYVGHMGVFLFMTR